ncbi:phytase [Streptomyces sp. NPDC004647]|uniref:phytase n=1 Tax=Streptomyces sp. NPDC004647 TaxID=3154671 RepID=UPI0033ADEF4C
MPASSQGDHTFAAYARGGRDPYLGSFAVTDGPATDGPATDGVEHSDGSTVLNVPLGRAFPKGLLVAHDGEATPTDVGREGTNFTFIRWDTVASAFPQKLIVDTESFDRRESD